MSIKFYCSGCGRKLKAPEDRAGKRVMCPCGQKQTVPAPAPPRPAGKLDAVLDEAATQEGLGQALQRQRKSFKPPEWLKKFRMSTGAIVASVAVAAVVIVTLVTLIVVTVRKNRRRLEEARRPPPIVEEFLERAPSNAGSDENAAGAPAPADPGAN